VAAVARYLADKSALARLHEPTVAAILAPRVEAGLVATCAVIEFEVLWSTRSFSEFSTVRRDRRLGYEWLTVENDDWIRSLDVQERLWEIGSIRSVPLPDLLIAAVAERHRVSIVHYDADYDQIAAITGQSTEWIVPRGSVS
jgi:predicted nucleic acid-binding protein